MITTATDAGNGDNDRNRKGIVATTTAMVAVERLAPAVLLLQKSIIHHADLGATFEPTTWLDLDLSINAALVNASKQMRTGNTQQAKNDLLVCAIGVLSKINDVMDAEQKGIGHAG